MAWNYSNTSVRTTLSAGADNSQTTIQVGSVTGLPVSYPYSVIVDFDTAQVEIMTVTNAVGTTLTVTRGQDGTSAQSHAQGAVVVHGIVARDLREPQQHIEASGDVHGIGDASAVVGTATTQTLTNKTISGVSNTITGVPASAVSGTFSSLVSTASNASSVGLTARGVAGQTADIARFEVNGGSATTRVNSDGHLVASSVAGNVAVAGNLTATSVASPNVNLGTSATVTRASTGDIAYRTRAGANEFDSFAVEAGGAINLGSGTGAPDVRLFRSAADVLRTDDSLVVGGTLTVGSTNVNSVLSGQWQSYTVTTSFTSLGTGGAATGSFRRVGLTYDFVVRIQAGSTNPTGAGFLTFALPAAPNGTWVWPAVFNDASASNMRTRMTVLVQGGDAAGSAVRVIHFDGTNGAAPTLLEANDLLVVTGSFEGTS